MRSDSERTFTEQARRRQIVEGAIGALAEGGYGGASLAAIARRIGVSKGVLSYHFAGKEELLEQVVAAVTDDAREHMSARIAAAAPGRARLRAYIESNLEWMAGNRTGIVALLAIFNAESHVREGQPAHYADHHRLVVAGLEELVRDGQRKGELRSFDAHMAAVTVRAAIDAAGQRLGGDPAFDIAAYGRGLADFFDHAMRASEPEEPS
jgi:AcrR family transcriptional regulator